MAQAKLKIVDNGSDGNCLYYAYAISLMYYLRKNGNREIAEKIFTRLNLNAEGKAKLFYLLESEKNKPFTAAHIKRIIEPILGPALRHYAAAVTRENFKENPWGSSLFGPSNYGMICSFSKILQEKRHPASSLFQSNKFDNKDYIEAEIFKVNMDEDESPNEDENLDESLDKKKQRTMCDEMERFMRTKYEGIISNFDSTWFADAQNPGSLADIGNYMFRAKNYLEEMIGDLTIEFFFNDECKNLEAYISHLDTNYIWGTEETLMLMHLNLQGEMRVPIDDEHVEVQYDTPINLRLYREGNAYFSSADHGDPDIILNNSGNNHWLSLIYPKFYSIENESFSRNDLLDLVGFNAHRHHIFEKAEDLAESDGVICAELYKLYQRLGAEKKKFLSEKSQMTREAFAQSCITLLSDPATMVELQKQCGVKDILSNIINCLYLLVTFDFNNLLLGNFNVINPLEIDSTYHEVGLLKTSLKISLDNLENIEIPDSHQPSFN